MHIPVIIVVAVCTHQQIAVVFRNIHGTVRIRSQGSAPDYGHGSRTLKISAVIEITEIHSAVRCVFRKPILRKDTDFTVADIG